ncbi:Diacylglycerol kinase zeta [Anabarilius grahami]|uniref:Diacylglycerol kinase zeta n=1 Tax=Anabarilius grahami TaxID=495550 RepID=A0A3N0YBC3_ANAGA|nr:Diacylglycerol kinase zeta [Anabarilius grahami]
MNWELHCLQWEIINVKDRRKFYLCEITLKKSHSEHIMIFGISSPVPDVGSSFPLVSPLSTVTPDTQDGRQVTLPSEFEFELEFHESREAKPERFNSPLRNKMFYAGGVHV